MYADKINDAGDKRSGASSKTIPQLPEIPRGRYTDEAFHRSEIDGIFKRTWLMAGHASELKEPGDHRLLDIPIAPIVAVRGEDGVIRAFLNSCRHRGATVVRQREGRSQRLNCQYHGWSYDLQGRLCGIPDEGSFPGLNRSDYGLVRVRCEQWGGFFFINLDPEAPPLLDWLAPVVKRYSGPTQAPLRVIEKLSFEVNCNWKIAVEAFRESYHAATIHRKTAVPVILAYEPILELYENGHGSLLSPYRPEFLRQQSVNRGGFTMQSSLPTLTGIEDRKYLENVVMAQMFPNYYLAYQTAGFPVLIKWPLSVNRSRLDLIWYGMDWGEGPRPAEWDTTIANFNVLLMEDLSNLESIQASVEADAGSGFPLSSKETLLYHLHASIDRHIGKENIPVRLRVGDALRDFVSA